LKPKYFLFTETCRRERRDKQLVSIDGVKVGKENEVILNIEYLGCCIYKLLTLQYARQQQN
jgi:hypothetical protein